MNTILERLQTRFAPRIVQPDDLAREAHDEIKRLTAENERLLAACVAVDDMWSNDALSYAGEMAIPSPVGVVWGKVRDALRHNQQSGSKE